MYYQMDFSYVIHGQFWGLLILLLVFFCCILLICIAAKIYRKYRFVASKNLVSVYMNKLSLNRFLPLDVVKIVDRMKRQNKGETLTLLTYSWRLWTLLKELDWTNHRFWDQRKITQTMLPYQPTKAQCGIKMLMFLSFSCLPTKVTNPAGCQITKVYQ